MTVTQNAVLESSNGFKSNGFLLTETKTQNVLFNLRLINTRNLRFEYQDSV